MDTYTSNMPLQSKIEKQQQPIKVYNSTINSTSNLNRFNYYDDANLNSFGYGQIPQSYKESTVTTTLKENRQNANNLLASAETQKN